MQERFLMSLRRRLEYDLSRIVDAISDVDGVIAIILFGSIARGDYDESSDYDILVIFKDKEAMWSNWDRLFEEVGRLRLLMQLIPMSYDELLNSEPTFLKEIYRDGIILYSRYPFTTRFSTSNLKHRKLIIYNLKGLRQSQKVKLLYKLYGKRGLKKRGLINEIGGEKLGEGCLIIPPDDIDKLLKIFREYNVKFEMLDIYLPNH